MAKKTRSGVWQCVGGFAAPIGDHVRSVPDGALVPHEFGYEVMDGREHLFRDVTQVRSVEQATAAPGEKRDVVAPADDDLDALRAEAEAVGVKVDKRWKADRLREEIEAAKG
jgi:hypothetical protein